MSRPALKACLTIFLCAGSLAAAPPAPSPQPTATATPADPLDALPENELKPAVAFIKKKYVAPAALQPAELERATLAGLIERLGRGVALLPAAANIPAPAPFYQEIIDGHIGYLRPGALRKNDLAEMVNALRTFAAKNVDALILDLRASGASTDYGMAADFANLFVAKGEPLFSLRGTDKKEQTFTSERAPSYGGLSAILIDEEIAGAPEVLASVLRARARAILIGHATAGGAVGYADLPLPGGMILRVAAEEAMLGTEQIGFPAGVQPDLAVTLALAVKREIFSQSLTKGMAAFVFEGDRPHLNEAALLAGTNPEIEAAQAAQQRRARGETPPVHDPVVQRAVDVITSIGVYAKAPGQRP